MKLLHKPTTNACLVLAFCFISCNNEKKTAPKEEKVESKYTYVYEFTDSSVPPQYHRSYSIKVMPGWVYLSVNSYGDILLSDTSALSDQAYTEFSKSIKDLNIKTKKEEANDGCTGGTTDELDLYSGTEQQVKGHQYDCGGKTYGELDGDVEAAKNLFRNIVPEIGKKIDGTRKDG